MLEKHLIAATAPVADVKNIIVSGKYRVTVLAAELFRIEEDETGTFCDEATQAVWFRNAKPVDYKVEMSADNHNHKEGEPLFKRGAGKKRDTVFKWC